MLNVSAGALLSRRTPPESRGTAAARFGAVISGANALGFLLGGVLLDVVPVRATVAAAGVFGLVVTAAAAVPMLRAAARERAVATEGPGTAPGSVAALALAELQPAA